MTFRDNNACAAAAAAVLNQSIHESRLLFLRRGHVLGLPYVEQRYQARKLLLGKMRYHRRKLHDNGKPIGRCEWHPVCFHQRQRFHPKHKLCIQHASDCL